jgi:2-dehydro-3-deoxyphosphogalactonate aldolase
MTSALLNATPIIAILRGLTPAEAPDIAAALFEAGVRCVEVPLNSPSPLQSIEAIRKAFDGRMLIGAGTVLTPSEVDAVVAAGGEIIVSPNMNAQVVERTKLRGLLSFPGIFTPSEAFAALESGADGLKVFPASVLGPAFVKALRPVLPEATPLYAVGGIGEPDIGPYLAAGVTGFGLGSSVYAPRKPAADVHASAKGFVSAWRNAGKQA